MKCFNVNKNLILIILTAVLFQIYLFVQKENFHIDELFSYVLANNDNGMILFYNSKEVDNKVLTGDFLNQYLIKQKEGGSLINTWQKVSQDNHMPIYFILLRLFNIFDNTYFNPLSGVFLNIFCFIFLLVGFYKTSFLLFENENIATVSVGIFSFFQPVLSLEVFIRMYLLLMTFSVWLIYFMVFYFKEQKNKHLLWVFILTLLTILTHYYSFIFCFLLAFFVCLRFLFEKKFKQIFLFGFTMLLAVFFAYLSFPTMIKTGLYGERGSQFWSVLKEFNENPLYIIKRQIPLFIDTLFFSFWFFIGFCFLFFISRRKEKARQDKIFSCFFWIFVGYGVLTSLVMPKMLHYQVRYFSPIISVFIILIIYIIINLGNKYKLSQSRIFAVLCFIMFFTAVKNIIWQNSPFYMRGTRYSRRTENLVKGADVWWGFGGGWQYAWMIHLYVDKLAKADKTWVLENYYHPGFIEFSKEEVKNKKYAYLFMPKTQEYNIDGAIEWIKKTTGRKAYYLYTVKNHNTAAMVLEASIYLVCPF